MKKVVSTFIFGNYDELKEPKIVTAGWDHVCFTDDPGLRSQTWDVRPSRRRIWERSLEDKKFAMKHMILFHRYLPGYDLAISVGGQFRIVGNLDAFIDRFLDANDEMLLVRHPRRNCAYDEAVACKALLKDDPDRIDQQMQRYRAQNYPEQNGLYATGFMARRYRSRRVKAACNRWYRELRRGSRRDQLSLNFALWRSKPFPISVVDRRDVLGADRFFELFPHKRPVHLQQWSAPIAAY